MPKLEPIPDGYWFKAEGQQGMVTATVHRPEQKGGDWRINWAVCTGPAAVLQGKSDDLPNLASVKAILAHTETVIH